MRTLTGLFILTVIFFSSSCAGTNKLLKRDKNSRNDIAAMKAENKYLYEAPVREVEERLVSINDKAPDHFNYFVIIGSFRNPDNARKHQSQIRYDGFSSEILRNEAGLYRVSVLSTDDIAEARAEVRRIWANYQKYSDTWLLIRKN